MLAEVGIFKVSSACVCLLAGMLDICEGIDRLALYTDDPQEALRSAQGPNTQTATIHPSSSSSSKKQQQGAVDCLPLLYTPLRLA